MPFVIVRQDISQMHVDAIVNAANTELQMGGGVCGAIFKAAGARELQAACAKLAPINMGDAVITPGFNLPVKFVIHAAGPVYKQNDQEKNERLLRACYINSLNLAAANGCKSIAFPLISSGIYGYPKTEALAVATTAIADWLTNGDLDVYLAVFDREAFAVSERLMGDVKSYIDEHYVDMHQISEVRLLDVEIRALDETYALSEASVFYSTDGLEALIGDMDESFSTTILRLIDAKGQTDVDVYKRANISRKLFSKIRTDKDYTPSKPTALALAIALELTLQETADLLESAGFALSHSKMFDVIIEYFIVNGNYNIFAVNEVLFKYDLPLLGA